MGRQNAREGEPLAAFPEVGELPVPLLLHVAPAALEGQELLVSDGGQPLSRTPAGSDLHPAVVAEVVDDVDPGERQIGVGGVAVSPSAVCAVRTFVEACAENRSAQRARAGQEIVASHSVTIGAVSDIIVLGGA